MPIPQPPEPEPEPMPPSAPPEPTPEPPPTDPIPPPTPAPRVERELIVAPLTRSLKRPARVGCTCSIDTARNGYAQTAAPPCAVRGRPGAPVATPIECAGVSSRHPEPWDDYECAASCGTFQYRQRTP